MSEITVDSAAIGIANQIVDEMQDEILAPFNAGVYFSKYDLLGIADAFGATKRMNDRKKILKEIFRYVDTREDLVRLMGLFIEKIDRDVALFDAIEGQYANAADVTAEWKTKAALLKSKLEDYREAS
jgi:hypothetical protein